jgi:hypothetical protein
VKGIGLYKSGRVSICPNGLFKVSGFEVDTERVQCECPDDKTRKESCEHLFTAMLFVKNRGKEGLNTLMILVIALLVWNSLDTKL